MIFKKLYNFFFNSIFEFNENISIKAFIFLFLIFIFFALFIVLRLFNITSSELNNTNSEMDDPKETRRVHILDRDYKILAETYEAPSLFATPNNIISKDKNNLINELSIILNLDKEFIRKKIESDKKFVWIKSILTPTEHQKIINLGDIGLNFFREEARNYPYGNLFSNILGYTNIDNEGVIGIEKKLNSRITNQKQGSLLLSLDTDLQYTISSELSKIQSKIDYNYATSIFIDIKNGEILSLVSNPSFNINNLRKNKKSFKAASFINSFTERKITNEQIAKQITLSIALEEGLINSQTLFDVSKPYKGIIDYNYFNGTYNYEECYVNNSAICFSKIADLIGKDLFIDYYKKIGLIGEFNFQTKVNYNSISSFDNVNQYEIAQGINIQASPIQWIKAYSYLLNHYLIEPTLLINEQNNKIDNIIFSNHTRYSIKTLLLRVLSNYEKLPEIFTDSPDLVVASSSFITENNNTFNNLNSFMTYFPHDNPQYLIFMILQTPNKKVKNLNSFNSVDSNLDFLYAPLVTKEIIDKIKISKKLNLRSSFGNYVEYQDIKNDINIKLGSLFKKNKN